MQVGILGGTGPLGRGLALRLAHAGAAVVVGSRDPGRAEATARAIGARLAQGGGASGNGVVAARPQARSGEATVPRGASNEEAASQELVVVATPWDAAVVTAAPLAGRLEGKVVVSVANALVRRGGEFEPLVGSRGSVAVALQAALPGAAVVAAGHHLPAPLLERLEEPVEADVVVCGDRDDAVQRVAELFELIPGVRALVAGSLAQACAIEAFTAVLLSLNLRYRGHGMVRVGGLGVGGP
jgi:NADPH-dependent F420 reductase